MLLLQAAVTESMKTPVPALVLILIFLCQGWGRHFLLSNKDSNLTDFQYNEDYRRYSCRAQCWSNDDCPSSCSLCMTRRDYDRYIRLGVASRPGKRRNKRAVNGYKVAKQCFQSRHLPKSVAKSSCFGPTNTVETKEGMKTIPELRIGDLIRTSSGDHHTDFTEVSET